MKKWMQRADYEATLKVTEKPKIEQEDHGADNVEDPFIDELDALVKIDYYMTKTNNVVKEYAKVLRENNEKRKLLKQLRIENIKLL